MPLLFKKPKPHKTRDGKIALTLAAHAIDTVLDIGANQGQTGEALREAGFSGQIISIEPLPALQESLKKKSARDKNWTILPPLALGERNGECTINVSEATDMSSLLPSSDELLNALPRTRVTQTVTVPMKTLDALYDELDLSGRNVFIKMDTQGYEMKILQNAQETLKKIKGIQVEMSLFPLYRGEALFDEIISFLKSLGFEPHMLIETNFSRTLNRQLQVDGIFFRESNG